MKEKVLLIDDEPDFLEALSDRMEARGIDVTTTTSAAEALEMIKAGSFDAVIVDFMMPEIDGLNVLQKIKKIRPESQIILLTGYATVRQSREAMKLGALDLIEKPADLEELTRKIKQAHEKRVR